MPDNYRAARLSDSSEEAAANMSIPDLITMYVLMRSATAGLMLLLVASIAGISVWSRNAARRTQATDTLRLLVRLFTGR